MNFENSKKNFKQTEIGKIPQDWEVKKLSQVGKVMTGKGVKNLSFGKYPIIGSNGPLGYTNKYLEDEDLIYTGRVGTIGKINYQKRKKIWLSDNVLYFKTKNTDLLKYVYYFLKNIDFSYLNVGSTQPLIKQSDLKELLIAIPRNENEQKAIARILSSLDDKIELNQRINKTLEAIAQAIFKHWFIDFEFPNEEGKPYKSSGGEMVYNEELGKEIPKGWRVGIVNDVAHVVGGGTPSKRKPQYFTKKGIPWLTPKDLSGYDWKYIDRGAIDISREGLENSSAKLMPPGTVLFTSRAPIGYAAVAMNEVTTNQGFKSLVPKENMVTDYLYYFIKKSIPLIQSLASGSTFKEISGNEMKKIPILIPPYSLLLRFENLLLPLNKLMINIREENIRLTKIRDTLLPKLMSGKIRVPVEVMEEETR